MTELWPFSPWEVGWFHWEPHWTKGDPWVFIYFKKIQNWSRNSWVMAIFPLWGCVSLLGTTLDKKGTLQSCTVYYIYNARFGLDRAKHAKYWLCWRKTEMVSHPSPISNRRAGKRDWPASRENLERSFYCVLHAFIDASLGTQGLGGRCDISYT